MPSPFPGMDPYIQGQFWRGIHSQFIAELQRVLAPLVHARILTYIEESVYLLQEPSSSRGQIVADAFVVERRPAAPLTEPGGRTATATLAAPVRLQLPQLEYETLTYLEVRTRDTGRVACIIEVLSPVNKRLGAGRQEYLRKRAAVQLSTAHLIEIDLLREGPRLPMAEAYPPCEHVLLVSRAEERPDCLVWPVQLRERLPTIPVPLLAGDADVALDIQAVFERVYDAAGYPYSLDYLLEPEPPLGPEDQEWAREQLRAAGFETAVRGGERT